MSTSMLARASVAAIAASFASTAAFAQSAVEALQDEILVTGTKKKDAENVQEVPLAVTAYGADQIDALKVRDLQSLTTAIPNVSFDDAGTVEGSANFSIRGVGINSTIPSIDPTVGVFVDGMYLGQNSGVVLDLFDLESIEVLRGPQGILFGRNVTGGAVLINTKRPGNEFEASFKGAVESGLRGTGAAYYAMGAVGGPLVKDVLSARVSAYYKNDRGWHERYLGGPVPNALAAPFYTAALGPAAGPAVGALVQGPGEDRFENFGESETILIRPSVLFTPTDSLELLVRYEHGESDGDGPPAQNHTDGLGNNNFFFSAPRDTFDFSIDNEGFYDTEWDHVIAEATLDVPFGDGQIKNIFGWRQLSQSTDGDIDATPLFLFHSDTELNQDQISNEIRYNGRFFDRVGLTAGFYYFTQDVAYDERRRLLGGFQNFAGGGSQDHDVLGVFGQFDIDLTDRFTLTIGGRYTDETKDVEIANIAANGNVSTTVFGVPGCSVVNGTCPVNFADSANFQNFTPKVGFSYAATDWFNVYAHWTEGVRSGGYNFRNTSTSTFLPGPFDEEEVNAFEIGFKAQPMDGRATINAAIYLNEIDNMQREINLPDPTTGVLQVIDNTANADIRGFEIEGRFAATDNLLLTGSLGHTNGDYEELFNDLNGDTIINQADFNLEIPRLVPWTWSAGFIHSAPIGDNTVNTRFNYSHRDASFYTDNNLGRLNQLDIIDASIAYTAFDDRATLSFYGRNLLNQANHGNDTQLPASLGGGTFAPLTKGRVVGIELQVNY